MDNLSPDEKSKLLAAAVARLKRLQLREAFDPTKPDSRPTPAQLEVLQDFGHIPQQWIVTGNQAGKTATCARNLTWFITDSHPYWKRPKGWEGEALLALVCGRTGKQIEHSLVPRIVGFLEEGTYKVVRVGNITQHIELLEGPGAGNKIVFQSLENPNQARERLQSFVAHFCWTDEMPNDVSIIGEILTRLIARNGYFMASFTPLVHNQSIKNMVEGATLPSGKRYRFRMFDNPVYSSPERQAEIIQGFAHLSESERNARLFGDWVASSSKVYDPEEARVFVPVPDHYSPGWRHVRSVDPAISSKLGYVLLAEDPSTGHWWVVKAKYIEGIRDPNVLFELVLKEDMGYNIMRRVCDPHETWFIGLASAKQMTHVTPYDKSNRRGEMISKAQSSLGKTLFIGNWNRELWDELTGMQWSETTEGKIANSSKYHQHDALLYALDCLPPADKSFVPRTWYQEVMDNHRSFKKKEATRQMVANNRITRRTRWKSRSFHS